MKHIIILGDGMADEPVDTLGGITPLEAATTPALDELARRGRTGLLTTVPEGFAPGSEIANMGVLGYDVREAYEGRGVLEAASIGVDVPDGWIAMRCNILTLADGKIKNHSAGHISTVEADQLIKALDEALGGDRVRFHTGVSYRHLLLVRSDEKRFSCTPPHDVPGYEWEPLLPKADVPEAEDVAAVVRDLIVKSQDVLANHPVNLLRVAEGKDPANSIWPWSPGFRPTMEPMSNRFGVKQGVVISAVDLIFGIGVYAGLKPIHVKGATGLYNTNYAGKTAAAIEALRSGADFVFLHIEASDEAGHEGDVALKIKTIENLDSQVVAPILKAAEILDEPLAIALLPDHPTPCRVRTHTSSPVPVAIYTPGIAPDDVTSYSEAAAAKGSLGHMDTLDFIDIFLNDKAL